MTGNFFFYFFFSGTCRHSSSKVISSPQSAPAPQALMTVLFRCAGFARNDLNRRSLLRSRTRSFYGLWCAPIFPPASLRCVRPAHPPFPRFFCDRRRGPSFWDTSVDRRVLPASYDPPLPKTPALYLGGNSRRSLIIRAFFMVRRQSLLQLAPSPFCCVFRSPSSRITRMKRNLSQPPGTETAIYYSSDVPL